MDDGYSSRMRLPLIPTQPTLLLLLESLLHSVAAAGAEQHRWNFIADFLSVKYTQRMVVSLNMQNTEIGWHGGWMWCWQFVRDDNNKYVSECGRGREMGFLPHTCTTSGAEGVDADNTNNNLPIRS